MINTSKYISGEERKIKIMELRKKHQVIFDALGDSEALFFPKLAYRPEGKDEPHISFFVSEIRRGADIYTEFVGSSCDSEDPNRTLWKWNYNPHWKEEYDTTEGLDNGPLRYLIPVSELVKVELIENFNMESESLLNDFDLNDLPISEMTLRDFAAIIWKQPVSTKPWLNNLIK